MRTDFEKARIKLIDSKNVIEVEAFKNGNNLIFLSKEQEWVSLYATGINVESTVSQSKLFDKVMVDGNMKGIWNISVGSGFDNFIYLCDVSGATKIIPFKKWSKDGKKIVYVKQQEEYTNISVFDFNKNQHIQITNSKNKSFSPDWSYYGDKIVYITEENGRGVLYLTEYK